MSNYKKIAIIGGGYVGLHTALRLKNDISSNKIVVFDILNEKIQLWKNKKTPINDHYIQFYLDQNNFFDKINYQHINDINYNNFDSFFICLSTNPKNGESKLNIEKIITSIQNIKNNNSKAEIFVRSTINLTDYNLKEFKNINYWPEFLSQGKKTELNLYSKYLPMFVYDKKILINIFSNNTIKNIYYVSLKEAIFIKLFHNSLDASLINLTNLFANIAQKNSIDFKNLSKIVENLLINRNKIKTPGLGFGGSCYPKDLESLLETTDNKYDINFLKSLVNFNKNQSNIFLRYEKEIKKAKNVGVLGISYKGQTNDTTKSPALNLINYLFENKNNNFFVWEPKISPTFSLNTTSKNLNILEFNNLIDKCDLIIIGSNWEYFKKLTIMNLKGKTILDLKSMFTKNDFNSNVNYKSLEYSD